MREREKEREKERERAWTTHPPGQRFISGRGWAVAVELGLGTTVWFRNVHDLRYLRGRAHGQSVRDCDSSISGRLVESLL